VSKIDVSRRKIFKLGKRSYVVAVPKNWVREMDEKYNVLEEGVVCYNNRIIIIIPARLRSLLEARLTSLLRLLDTSIEEEEKSE